jgi:hypothetical protein
METKIKENILECELPATKLEETQVRYLEAQISLLEAKATLVLAQAESVKRTSFPI